MAEFGLNHRLGKQSEAAHRSYNGSIVLGLSLEADSQMGVEGLPSGWEPDRREVLRNKCLLILLQLDLAFAINCASCVHRSQDCHAIFPSKPYPCLEGDGVGGGADEGLSLGFA